MKKGIVIGIGVVVLGIAWALFRPELLFINKEVNEELPGGGGAGLRPERRRPSCAPGSP